jgi:hypothetical protein
VIAQTIHNPRPGRYTFAVHVSGGANDDPAFYDAVWQSQFRCRAAIFRYTSHERRLEQIVPLAAADFAAPFAGPYEGNYVEVSVSATIRDQEGGAAQLAHGIGVAVIVERVAAGALDLDGQAAPRQALVRLDDARIEFEPYRAE